MHLPSCCLFGNVWRQPSVINWLIDALHWVQSVMSKGWERKVRGLEESKAGDAAGIEWRIPISYMPTEVERRVKNHIVVQSRNWSGCDADIALYLKVAEIQDVMSKRLGIVFTVVWWLLRNSGLMLWCTTTHNLFLVRPLLALWPMNNRTATNSNHLALVPIISHHLCNGAQSSTEELSKERQQKQLLRTQWVW